jgi:alpha-1,3/alpha-1,6-mannosyltransferase
LIAELELGQQAQLLLSPDEREYAQLMRRCNIVVYTPDAEHLGIVPLEAMAAGKPVIAVNRGGPTETVVDGETGFLREPTPSAFAEAAGQLLLNPEQSRTMGEAGQRRVERDFSRRRFGDAIERILCELAGA